MDSRGRFSSILVAGALVLAGCPGGSKKEAACRLARPATNGPGDVSNHFPVTTGSSWFYQARSSGPGAPPPSRSRVEVTGVRQVDGATVAVFSAVPLDGQGTASEALLEKGPGGLVIHAGPEVGRPASQLYPQLLVPFPLVAGTSLEQVSCTGLDSGSDLDGDGRNERLDARGTVKVVGEESVTTPAGTFTAMRVDLQLTLTLRGSLGQTATTEGTESDWLAPGVGLVRSTSSTFDGLFTDETEEVLLGYDVEGRRGGLARLASLTAHLAPGNSDTEMPGQPALSFDGTRHLLVTQENQTDGFAQASLRATLLAGDGTVVSEAPLSSRRGYGLRPAAAFNGTNHLVVSSFCNNDCSTIFAQRVTPAGALLDGAAGFDVTTGGSSARPPSVASDGDGWLVAWDAYQDGLHAARISAAGEVVGRLVLRGPLTPAPSRPVVAFGGGVYLVAWAEGPQVLAVRIQPDGTVLDAPPFAISTAPGDKFMGGAAFDGTRFLVTWTDARRGDPGINGPVQDVYASRVAVDGSLPDGPAESGGIVVNTRTAVDKLDPVVIFDGAHFVVTWWVIGFDADSGIFAARLRGDGTSLDGPASGTGLRIANPTTFGSRLAHPVSAPAADGLTLVAWADIIEVFGTTKSVLGAWFAW
jgi:hypothetical protein